MNKKIYEFFCGHNYQSIVRGNFLFHSKPEWMGENYDGTFIPLSFPFDYYQFNVNQDTNLSSR